MQPLYQIHDIDEFEAYDVILARLKGDGSGETRINILGSSGTTYPQDTWASTISDARIRQADKINCLEEILVLLDDGVTWEPTFGDLEPFKGNPATK